MALPTNSPRTSTLAVAPASRRRFPATTGANRRRDAGATGKEPKPARCWDCSRGRNWSRAFQRVARLTPGGDAAVEGECAAIAHAAQGRGGEGRDLAELAASEDTRGRIGQHLVDAQLELAASEMACAGDVPGLEGLALADVEHD